MSSVSKAIKKLGKVVLTVAAVALVAYGAASLIGAATAGGGAAAAAGTGSMSAAAGSTAAMTGGAASGAGSGILAGLGSAFSGMSPMTQSTLLMTGGNMLSGAMQPTEAEQYKDMREAHMATVQGTSGVFNQPAAQPEASAEPKIQPQAQIQAARTPQIARPEMQAQAAPETHSLVRFDPQAGRFVTG